nr:uncharacterized protein LOC109734612 [Aegilops tauschii subsp. strangulata]
MREGWLGAWPSAQAAGGGGGDVRRVAAGRARAGGGLQRAAAGKAAGSNKQQWDGAPTGVHGAHTRGGHGDKREARERIAPAGGVARGRGKEAGLTAGVGYGAVGLVVGDGDDASKTRKQSGEGDDPFWKRKPQDKPTKTTRPKTKATKKPAKKKTVESAERRAMLVTQRAQAKGSKRAKVNKPAEDSIPTDPEQTPEQSNPNTEAILDDPPPQDHET